MVAALEVLLNILDEQKLRGGSGKIRGGYTCICFTETPIGQLALSLANRKAYQFKYRACGVMVDKDWAYSKGARPAIYQPDAEYDDLPEALRYLHVRYEPTNNVDFTWEREWRVKADELPFTPDNITLIVPTRQLADALIELHTERVQKAVARGETDAVQRYPWHIIALSDLGMDVPDELT